jgi:hypothetical protein
MRCAALLVAMLLAIQLRAHDAPTTTTEPAARARFTSVDLFIDPHGQPLAAYQLEFLADPARVTLVGIEGGEHPAYQQPPYYDPKALSGHRVILAALSTATELPATRTRVATLHLRVTGGDAEPTYQAKIEVAGNREGKPIAADVTVGQGVE